MQDGYKLLNIILNLKDNKTEFLSEFDKVRASFKKRISNINNKEKNLQCSQKLDSEQKLKIDKNKLNDLESYPSKSELKKNDMVTYMGKKGTIIEINNKSCAVAIKEESFIYKSVKFSELQKIHSYKNTSSINFEKKKEFSVFKNKIDLHYLRKHEAQEELEKFISEAILHEVDEIKVVCGKGSGALKNLVKKVLTNQEFVKEINDVPEHMGGSGVKIVKLRYQK